MVHAIYCGYNMQRPHVWWRLSVYSCLAYLFLFVKTFSNCASFPPHTKRMEENTWKVIFVFLYFKGWLEYSDSQYTLMCTTVHSFHLHLPSANAHTNKDKHIQNQYISFRNRFRTTSVRLFLYSPQGRVFFLKATRKVAYFICYLNNFSLAYSLTSELLYINASVWLFTIQ